MPTGLFGKLPAKRDFIAMNAPRRFLDVYEPWLQGGIASARVQLGEDFANAYNSAPLWRFWLGGEVAGEATIGVFMSSVDGVGRSFPLTVLFSNGDAGPPPPEVDSNDAWFAAAEEVLLGALAEGVVRRGRDRGRRAAPSERRAERRRDVAGFSELEGGGVLLEEAASNWSLGFRAAGRFAQRRSLAGQTFWWTLGGGAFPALSLSWPKLPPPARFADYLSGRFAEAPASARAPA